MTIRLSTNSFSRLLILFLVLIASSSPIVAQNEVIDDLFSKLKDAKEDTNKVILLHDLCWEFGFTDLDSTLKYGKKAISLAKKLTYSDGEAVSRRYIARSYNFYGDYEKAIIQLKKGLATNPALKDQSTRGNLYNDLGNNYDASGDFESASKHFYNSLRIFQKLGREDLLGIAKINLCYFYYNFGDFEEMIKLAKEAEVHLKKIDDPVLVAVTYTLRGIAYGELEQYERALMAHNYAMKTYREKDAPDRVSEALSSIGSIYLFQGKFDLALDYYRQALIIDKSLGNPAYLAITYSNIAQVYSEKGDLKKSTEYFNKSIEIAKNAGRLEMLMTTLGYTAQTYFDAGNFEKAYEYTIIHQQIKDSLYSQEKSKQILEIREKYNLEKKEQEIINIKNETDAKDAKMKLTFTALGASLGILVLVLIIVVLYSRQRKNKEIQTRNNLEQRALRSQMNPHFIFNSLNSIQRLYIEGKEDLANDYMADFSSLLRRILENSGMDKVSLKEELRSTMLYLDLEKMRTDNLFNYEFEIDPLVDQLNSFVPPLILQPFVENAIWHGIVPKNEQGTIKVQISNAGVNDLACIITDDGIGISASKKSKVSGGTESKGMSITASRLGGDQNVAISELESGGTEIKLRIRKIR
ncbi:MAG: tetratricopeptide repeat protein [Crocinitomicaceae bacterium]|nr:tetratricopeptide repeat protein [Flavobacteriales bacterium]NQZ34870.1 tetratricopeptide repeat protein [Crocinitomicaceae bacterium]